MFSKVNMLFQLFAVLALLLMLLLGTTATVTEAPPLCDGLSESWSEIGSNDTIAAAATELCGMLNSTDTCDHGCTVHTPPPLMKQTRIRGACVADAFLNRRYSAVPTSMTGTRFTSTTSSTRRSTTSPCLVWSISSRYVRTGEIRPSSVENFGLMCPTHTRPRRLAKGAAESTSWFTTILQLTRPGFTETSPLTRIRTSACLRVRESSALTRMEITDCVSPHLQSSSHLPLGEEHSNGGGLASEGITTVQVPG